MLSNSDGPGSQKSKLVSTLFISALIILNFSLLQNCSIIPWIIEPFELTTRPRASRMLIVPLSIFRPGTIMVTAHSQGVTKSKTGPASWECRGECWVYLCLLICHFVYSEGLRGRRWRKYRKTATMIYLGPQKYLKTTNDLQQKKMAIIEQQ